MHLYTFPDSFITIRARATGDNRKGLETIRNTRGPSYIKRTARPRRTRAADTPRRSTARKAAAASPWAGTDACSLSRAAPARRGEDRARHLRRAGRSGSPASERRGPRAGQESGEHFGIGTIENRQPGTAQNDHFAGLVPAGPRGFEIYGPKDSALNAPALRPVVLPILGLTFHFRFAKRS